jgi:esterase/lipase
MVCKSLKSLILILVLILISGLSFSQNKQESVIKFDDTRKADWSSDFRLAEIKSTMDGTIQKAWFFKTSSEKPEPLIVSLHTWSGNYTQVDELAGMCLQKNINYIHPDFRGENWTENACCSELALNDIDDAISFAIKNANVDKTKIYVIGVSGGGYATLSTFMKSKHNIAKFSAWASISDLIAWYNESKIRGADYATHILKCTSSGSELNEEIAKQKSPLFWETPVKKQAKAKLFIYAGIYDGIQGSVPITHSINFYNKVLTDMNVRDTSRYVTPYEKLKLLEFRKPLGDFGTIGGRKICLKKESGNIRLTIFEGNHEMLTEYAFNELIKE